MHTKFMLVVLVCLRHLNSSRLDTDLSSVVWKSLRLCHLDNLSAGHWRFDEEIGYSASSEILDNPPLHTTLSNEQEMHNRTLYDDEKLMKDLVKSRIAGLSLSTLLKHYFHCKQTYWDTCFNLHTLSAHNENHNTSLLLGPCFHGHLHLHKQDYMLHIQVHPIFQINLTFTHFHLQLTHPYCKFHSVKVSKNLFICCVTYNNL